LDLLVLTHGSGGVEGGVEGVASGENLNALGQDGDGAHLLGDQGALFVAEDGEVLDEVVSEALSHTSSGTGGVLKLSDREGHGGESLVHFREESSGTLHLEHVLLVELTLEDGASSLVFLGDTFATGNVNVESDDISSLEGPLVNLLSRGLFLDDSFVRVDAVLEDLVGEDGLNGVNLESLTNARNSSSHVHVGVADTDSTLGSELGGVAGNSDIILNSRNLVGLGGADDAGLGGVRSPAINVASSHNFSNIAVSELDGLILEGRVVAHNVVH